MQVQLNFILFCQRGESQEYPTICQDRIIKILMHYIVPDKDFLQQNLASSLDGLPFKWHTSMTKQELLTSITRNYNHIVINVV